MRLVNGLSMNDHSHASNLGPLRCRKNSHPHLGSRGSDNATAQQGDKQESGLHSLFRCFGSYSGLTNVVLTNVVVMMWGVNTGMSACGHMHSSCTHGERLSKINLWQ